jgi:hypothetical protein
VRQALHQLVVELQRLDRRGHRTAHRGHELGAVGIRGELLHIGRDGSEALRNLVDLGVAFAHRCIQLCHAQIEELMQSARYVLLAGWIHG